MAFFSSPKTFFEAAMTGDVQELRYCLGKKGYSVNMKNMQGDNVLHIAIQYRQLEAVKFLAACQPDFEAVGKEGLTPLCLAMTKPETPQMALALIAGGANPNTHDANYLYRLHIAAKGGEMDIVKALVEHGADLNVRTRDKEDTPLHMAIKDGRRGVAEYLVKKGARIDIPGSDSKTQAQLAKEIGPKMLEIIDPAQIVNQNMTQPPSEIWEMATPTTVAKITKLPALARKITEIFNFETKERSTITVNLKTNAELVGESEPFASLSEDAIAVAADKLMKMGGKIPGNENRPAPSVGDSPLGRFKI